MKKIGNISLYIFLSPVVILLLTKLATIWSINFFPSMYSWIFPFFIYYVCISLAVFIYCKLHRVSIKAFVPINFKSLPNYRLLFFTILIPAILPAFVFVTQIKNVSLILLNYTMLFAIINPFFEELYWRSFLSRLSENKVFVITFSAFLFSFSHYFLWGFWFSNPLILFPTLGSTFIMGVLWMIFYQRQKNFLYLYISHFIVDILNLSVPVFLGLIDVSKI